MSDRDPGVRVAPQGGAGFAPWQKEGNHNELRLSMIRAVSSLLQR